MARYLWTALEAAAADVEASGLRERAQRHPGHRAALVAAVAAVMMGSNRHHFQTKHVQERTTRRSGRSRRSRPKRGSFEAPLTFARAYTEYHTGLHTGKMKNHKDEMSVSGFRKRFRLHPAPKRKTAIRRVDRRPSHSPYSTAFNEKTLETLPCTAMVDSLSPVR